MKHGSLSLLVRMALMAAFTAVCAQVAIPLPLTVVPVSLSVLAVLMTGALLPPGPAALTQVVYLLLGAVGAPVFARFTGGLPVLVGPTGGYILAYPFMALIVALAARRWPGRLLPLLLSMVGAMAVCYCLGTLWLMAVASLTPGRALMMAVVPFLPADGIKIAASLLLSRALRPLVTRLDRQPPPGRPFLDGGG